MSFQYWYTSIGNGASCSQERMQRQLTSGCVNVPQDTDCRCSLAATMNAQGGCGQHSTCSTARKPHEVAPWWGFLSKLPR